MYLHLKFGHQSLSYIQKTGQLGQIKGIPNNITGYDINCPLCTISSATKLPHEALKDLSELRKGSMFHADWIIFNVESCRGFKTALYLQEATTR